MRRPLLLPISITVLTMARNKPPRQMPWTAVTLDLSFDVQKELDIAIGAYISELDAIEREAGGRPDLEKQVRIAHASLACALLCTVIGRYNCI